MAAKRKKLTAIVGGAQTETSAPVVKQLGKQSTLIIEGDMPASVAKIFDLAEEGAPAHEETGGVSAFTQVRSNIKGGFDVKLAPLTAVVGKNRSRKTAILDALRLALTGTHPIGSQPAKLMELVPRGSKELQVDLVSSDSHLKVRVTGTRASATKLERTVKGTLESLSQEHFDALVPNMALADLLKLSPLEARRAVFQRWGKLTSIPTPAYLSTEQKARWEQGLRNVTADADLATQLTELPEIFRKTKLAANRDAKTAKASAAELSRQVAEMLAAGGLSTSDLSRADSLRNQLALQIQVDGAREVEQQVLRDVERFKVKLEKVPREVPAEMPEPEFGSLGGDAGKLPQLIERDRQKVELLTELMEAGKKAECCPLCRRGPVDPTLLNAVKARLAANEDKLRSAGPAKESEAHIVWREHQAMREKVLKLQQEVRLEHAELTGRLAGSKGAREQAEAMRVLSGVEIEVPVEQLQTQVSVLERAKAFLASAEQAETSGRELELSGKDWGILEQEAGLLLTKAMDSVREEAEIAVNRYLPVGFEVKLRLEEDGKPVCRWEVVGTDGDSHGLGAASGSEDTVLLVALACAWTEGAPVRVVLLDDRELGLMDPETLKATLGSLSARVRQGTLTQVVVAWTRPEEIPDGWTRVNV